MVTENPSSRGGGRGINTELNLVPFIDLLSTLVLFLLVSAVWMQVSVVPASTQKSGEAKASTVTTNDDGLVKIHLSSDAIEVVSQQSSQKLEKISGQFDWTGLKNLLSPAADKMKAAYLSSDDQVPYGQVIIALDQIKSSGLSTVSLKTE